MARSTHRKIQRKAAGKRGRTEVPINGRIDVLTQKKAVEIEGSGSLQKLEWACKKLLRSRKPHKILQVPDHHIEKAQRVCPPTITIRNFSGTKYRRGKRR
ncbi:hypothetical protein LR013_03645 [candidate division NPL-UPA2 bacterium]|nr:hypothetical protein [candidate division NPL-UPA2 bacterium]